MPPPDGPLPLTLISVVETVRFPPWVDFDLLRSTEPAIQWSNPRCAQQFAGNGNIEGFVAKYHQNRQCPRLSATSRLDVCWQVCTSWLNRCKVGSFGQYPSRQCEINLLGSILLSRRQLSTTPIPLPAVHGRYARHTICMTEILLNSATIRGDRELASDWPTSRRVPF